MLSIHLHHSGSTVDYDDLAVAQPASRFAGAHDGGDSVFAGHQRGVRSEAAAVGDDGGCFGEQRRPCRSGRFRDKHIPVAETAEVLRALHDAYRSGCASRRCGVPDDDVLADFSLTAGFCAARPITSPIIRTGCPSVKGAARLRWRCHRCRRSRTR